AVAVASGSAVRSRQAVPDRSAAGPRRWRGLRSLEPSVAVAAGGSALIVLVSAAGAVPAVVVALTVGAASAVGWRGALGPKDVAGTTWRPLIVLLPAAAGAGLVLSRAQSRPVGLALVGMVCAYDSAAYLIGTEADHPWEGPLAGLVSIAALTLFVATELAPPFRGASPWVLGGLAALLAPLGPVVAGRLLGERHAPAPALRRLDSLLLLAPAWAIAAAVLLQS
ncbi:MAG TPA: hypothetical protein VKQ71_00570, partial [Acidimicrobiales bacterium]|nr:hypothetical protein [Acidimicrobiales bacterium]